MAGTVVLTEAERDPILATLSQEQRDFLDTQLNSRRRTAFMFELAKRKGRFITDTMTDAEIAQIVEDWTFLGMHDAGPDWNKTRQLHCECGRPLRYQYVIQNNITGDVLRLGADHLEQHADIDAATAKAIVRGLERANLEADERLANVAQGLRFEDQVREEIPENFSLPQEITEVVTLGLPLIQREIGQFMRALDEYRRQQGYVPGQGPAAARSLRTSPPPSTGFSQSFFGDDDEEISVGERSPRLTESARIEIDRLMGTGMQSAVALSEVLARGGYASKERYATGRLRIYPLICMYLDQASAEGRVELLSSSLTDRTYHLIGLDE